MSSSFKQEISLEPTFRNEDLPSFIFIRTLVITKCSAAGGHQIFLINIADEPQCQCQMSKLTCGWQLAHCRRVRRLPWGHIYSGSINIHAKELIPFHNKQLFNATFQANHTCPTASTKRRLVPNPYSLPMSRGDYWESIAATR